MNEQITSVKDVTPIVKSIFVPLPLDLAFRLFAENTASWWPLRSHSVGGERAVACHLEGKTGGRFYEVQVDGSESEWGRVLHWEPPRRIVMTFYPGRSPENATEVEVTFHSEASGTCLTLTHRRWELCSPEIQAERAGYVSGWDYVLRKYVSQASAGA